MSHSESGGGFLSKVVRFVRHPTVSWSELDRPADAAAPAVPASPGPGPRTGDSQLPATQDPRADREALKAAIERKRRNDHIRKAEFKVLRELMRQKQAAAGVHPERDRPDVQASENPASDAGSAKTIENIARIEAQMAQHWLSRPGNDAERERLRLGGSLAPDPTRSLEGGVTVPGHLQAVRAPAASAPALPIDMLADLDHAPAPPPVEVPSPQALEEAAVRFANGEDQAAEQALRALLAQEVGTPAARVAWWGLMDWAYARGELDRFEETAAEYAEQFRVDVPRWPGSPSVAGPAAAPVAAGAGPGPAVWVCPPLLDVTGVQALTRVVAAAQEVVWLDWTALVAADLDAAQALLDQALTWVERPLEFRCLGGGVLRRRLKASTPSGRRENDPVWWSLRLAMLRLMHHVEEFDLAALDFCVTYGVLPPVWSAPTSRYQTADALPGTPPAPAVEPEAPLLDEPIRPLVTQLGGLDVMEWPAMTAEFAPPAAGAAQAVVELQGGRPQLVGALSGDASDALRGLQAALAQHPGDRVFSIDCQRLTRIDFVAAGSLLQWLLGVLAQGVPVELTGVNRLVGTFLHVVGIDEAVTVRLREY